MRTKTGLIEILLVSMALWLPAGCSQSDSTNGSGAGQATEVSPNTPWEKDDISSGERRKLKKQRKEGKLPAQQQQQQ